MSELLAREEAILDTFRLDYKRAFETSNTLDGERLQAPPPDEAEWSWAAIAQHYGRPTRLLDWSRAPRVALFFAVLDDAAYNDDAATLFALYDKTGIRHGLKKLNANVQNARPFLPNKELGAFPRILAQRGFFTYQPHPLRDLKEQVAAESRLCIWHVPAEAKESLRGELARAGITAATLFPDPDVAEG